MKIAICLYLCQNKHCITAAATILEPPTETKDKALAEFKEVCERLVKPWCNLCGSRYVSYEIRDTDYKDLGEAWAELQKLEQESRSALGSYFLRRN